jgi:hypothetical protein
VGSSPGQHNGAGAETVTEGVHADSRFALGGLGASRFLSVATVGLELFECCHRVILTNKAKLGLGRVILTNKPIWRYLSLLFSLFLLILYFYFYN